LSLTNCLIGIFQIKSENYDTLQIALKDIIRKLENITSVTIDGKAFHINWMQGGDLKWLAIMNGINAANSNQPCVWCPWNKADKLDLDAKWTISDRSHEKSAQMITSTHKDGYIRVPFMKFINFQKCVVDPLHLCLRITDKIFSKLLDHIEYLDSNASCVLARRPLMQKLIYYLEFECKIQNPTYFSTNENKYKLRSLNQNERYNILEFMTEEKDLLSLFPEHAGDAKLLLLNFVLVGFYMIHKFIGLDHTNNFNEESLRTRLKSWLERYIKCTEGKKILPYIHILVFHVPEFITKYKNLSYFSMQALEKLNSITKNNYFSQSNRRPLACMKQLLDKANRNEFYHLKMTRSEYF